MSPNFAWYFLVLVPFIVLGAGASAWALTFGAFLLYRPVFLPYNELIWKTLATAPLLLTAFARRFPRTVAVAIPPGTSDSLDPLSLASTSVVIPCLNEE